VILCIRAYKMGAGGGAKAQVPKPEKNILKYTTPSGTTVSAAVENLSDVDDEVMTVSNTKISIEKETNNMEENKSNTSYDDLLDEDHDDEDPMLSPQQQQEQEELRNNWDNINMSLGLEDDDLLFNMMYFNNDASGNSDSKLSLGAILNSAMEETVAQHPL
jgi:hypothetical protein